MQFQSYQASSSSAQETSHGSHGCPVEAQVGRMSLALKLLDRLFASNQTQDRPALVSTFSRTSVPHSPFVFKHSPTLPLRHMLSTSTFVLFPTNISIGCLRTLHPPACRVSFLVKFLSFSFFREKLLDSWQSHFGHFEREVSLRLWVSFPGRTPGKSRAQIYNGE